MRRLKLVDLKMSLDCGYGLTQELSTRNGASPDNFIPTQLQRRTQPYLSELIWIRIAFLVQPSKSTERER